jgi:hypothetical protein
MHLLRPDKRLVRKPPDTIRFSHYMTEHGIVPAEVGVRGDAASLRLKEKFLLRAVLFWLNKGVDRLFLFHGGPDKDDQGMGLSLARVRDLKDAPPEAERDAWLSPAYRSLRRATAAPERKVFEMPAGTRTLYFHDLFTVLPFQVNARKFVFAVYVMSPTYPQEDLAEQPWRVALRPVGGVDATVSGVDPLSGRAVPVTVRERARESLTVEVPATDTPRLLVVEEANR